jgi:hypothetical protein
MAFHAGHPTFRTTKLDTALVVAINLAKARFDAGKPIQPGELTRWIADRFPNLSDADKGTIALELRQLGGVK